MSTAHPSLCTALAAAAVLGASLAAAPALAQEPPPPSPAPIVIRVETAPAALPPTVYVRGPGYTPGELADWDDGAPVPPGFRPVKRARKSLVIAGAVTFGSVYLTTGLLGAIASDAGARGAGTLLVPVLGPLVMLGYQQSATGGFMLVLDSLAQAAGVTMFAVALVMPKTVLLPAAVGKIELIPTPMAFGPSSAGLGLKGTF